MNPVTARNRALQCPQRPAETAGGINYRAIRASADRPQTQTRRVQRTGGGSLLHATRGKLFTSKTLDHLVEATDLAKFAL